MTPVKLWSEGSGPPILLLHAFPLHSGMWERQIADLKGEALLLAPDLPGFGGSSDAETAENLDAIASMLYELVRTRGIERAIVAGCSMGGYLAFAFLRAAPDFVAGLALINTRSAADSEPARANRMAMVERVQREGSSFLVGEWPPSALSPVTLHDRPAVLESVATMVAEATPRGVIAAQRAMAGRPDSTALLSTLRVPTVVVHGLDDRIIAESESRAMAAAIAGAKFVGVPQAGHLPNLEQPEMVSAALRELAGRFTHS